ncbi:GNAT family N-acetyltransferase [Aureispira anguillae]|uniref:GNAT family N-acetyltransferase n=1 Tax=Aureispira anguillae TaxID=2864201 RepID=A0A915YEB4_9BACT|nr:GNAT family N-acetyltransferase [Aureispira anguillae]BDS11431.1 GNAT family N-acetyltransferase [Aureispira anguillae]
MKQILSTDIPKIIEYASNKEISSNTLNIPYPYEEKDAIYWINSANQGFLNKTQFTFAIRLKSTDEFIGGIGLILNKRFDRAEFGYWIGKPFWKNGYATEALAALLKFGFKTLNLNKIYATHLIENPASGKVMLKNGMLKEATLIEHYKKGDEYRSVFQYRLTKKEFELLNVEANIDNKNLS